MKTDGTDRRRLGDAPTTQNANNINVVDGRIYYTHSYDLYHSNIYSMNIDGTDVRKLCDDDAASINVVGDRIYYINNSDFSHIYSMKTDGTDRRQLNDDGSWFPNVAGDRIYYSGTGLYLYSVRIDGTDVRQLNDERTSTPHVIGDRVFYYDDDVTHKFYTIKTDGTGLQTLEDFVG
jgi:tricorn protease-like protein